jgi:hypothetical protein
MRMMSMKAQLREFDMLAATLAEIDERKSRERHTKRASRKGARAE